VDINGNSNSPTSLAFSIDNIKASNQLDIGYRNWKLNVCSQISSTQDENLNGFNTTNYTSVKLSNTVGCLTNSATASFTGYGNDYGISTAAKISKNIKDKFTIAANPELSATYNTGCNNITLSPSINLSMTYQQNKDLNYSLNINESNSIILSKEATCMNNFNAMGNISYKGLNASLTYGNNCCGETYITNVSYENNKIGKIGVGYSHQNSSMPVGNRDLVSVSYVYTFKNKH
ncbi:MAG: hypothetical protein MJ231_06345, partial [bacterium]|nr:hypothetical protein [bacterium]